MAQLDAWIENQPRKNIAAILRYVVGLLDEEIREVNRHDRHLVQSLGLLLQQAWEEAKADALKLPDLAHGITSDRLADHGLNGKQLELKFRLLGYFAAWYGESREDSVLKQLLDYINKILPSIIGAMTGQTFLDEIKKCLETLVWGMSRD